MKKHLLMASFVVATTLGEAANAKEVEVSTKGGLVHLGFSFKDIGDDKAVGLEVAAISGPFHVQAEYLDGEDTDSDSLKGFYVQLGYILTGEIRPYKNGSFKRVEPGSAVGAWETVLRYEDGDGSYGDIELGNADASAFTVGLNWYANNNVRAGINYTKGEDNRTEDEGNEFRVRFQLAF